MSISRRAVGLGGAAALLAAGWLTGCNGSIGGEGGGAQATSTSTSGSGGSGGAVSSGGSGGQSTSPSGGSGGTAPDPCAGVDCSGLGQCVPDGNGQPSCDCNAGYHAVGLTCVVDESCQGVTCGRCASCEVVQGLAECVCPDGFAMSGVDCHPSPNPCDTYSCNPDQVCVPEHHCIIDPVCVETCDCSNCGTCDMQDFVDTGAWALYCGSGQQGPATMACTKPCPPGQGCIPYSTPICWGGQGCMSL